RGGVQLKGGVGAVGDTYERHADAVADLVVQGKSAESLLDAYAGGGGGVSTVGGAVQRLAGKHDMANGKTTFKHVVPLVEAGFNVLPLEIPYMTPPLVKPLGVNLFAKTAAEFGITVPTGVGAQPADKPDTFLGALDGLAAVVKGELGIEGGWDLSHVYSGLVATLYGKGGLSVSLAPGKDLSIVERDGGYRLQATLPVTTALSAGVRLWDWDEAITL